MVIPDGWPINGRWQMGPGACRLWAAHQTVQILDVGDLVASSASKRVEVSLQIQTAHLDTLQLSAAELRHNAYRRHVRLRAQVLGKMHLSQHPQAVIRLAPYVRNGGPVGSQTPAMPDHRDQREASLPDFEAKAWQGSHGYGDKTFRRGLRTRSATYAAACRDTASSRLCSNIELLFPAGREPSSYRSNFWNGRLPLLYSYSLSYLAYGIQKRTTGNSIPQGIYKQFPFWGHQASQSVCPCVGGISIYLEPPSAIAARTRPR